MSSFSREVAGRDALLAELSQQRIPRRERIGPLPLTENQEEIWAFERLSPGTPAYNLPAAVRVGGPLDVGALERALHAVIRRHETLRTGFVMLPNGEGPL